MKGPTIEPTELDGVTKYFYTYRIKFNTRINPTTLQPEGWLAHLLHQGTMYRASAGDTDLIPFRAETDHTTGNLDADGTARDPALDPLWKTFNKHPLVNFNTFNLGPYA
jgi:hypothetical protein